MPEAGQATAEFQKLLLGLVQIPVEPREFIVLAVGIVISQLCFAKFVPAAKHGHALRQQQCCKEISALPVPQSLNRGILRFAFDAAVPVVVVAVPVSVFFQIGKVPFLLVRDEVSERKSVMRGDEIDTGVRSAACVLVKITASCHLEFTHLQQHAPRNRGRRHTAHSGATTEPRSLHMQSPTNPRL